MVNIPDHWSTSLEFANIIDWKFEKTDNSNDIIPNELTHNYLLNNFNIDNSILKYYCLPADNLLSDTEFQRMVDSGFAGEKETVLYPYSIIIYGAYYSRTDLLTKLSSLRIGKRHKKINGNCINYFSDLIPYFKEYAKGFLDGFNDFDDTQIKPFLTLFAEKQDYVNKVFEYITKSLFCSHGWATLRRGFGTNQDEEIIGAFEDGQKQGYFYRAWSIVFSNNNLFAPLFQIQQESKPPQSINIDESRTKQIITQKIEGMDKQGWKYAFNNETDYNTFADLLTNFFEYKEYSLPEITIRLKRTCKTKLSKALGEIHKTLSENRLSSDKEFYKIIRILNHFEKETEKDLYKALIR